MAEKERLRMLAKGSLQYEDLREMSSVWVPIWMLSLLPQPVATAAGILTVTDEPAGAHMPAQQGWERHQRQGSRRSKSEVEEGTCKAGQYWWVDMWLVHTQTWCTNASLSGA